MSVEVINSQGGDRSRPRLLVSEREKFMSRYARVWLDFQEPFVRGAGTAFNVVDRASRLKATPRFASAPSYVPDSINTNKGSIQFVDNSAIGLPADFAAWNTAYYVATCIFRKPASDTDNGQLFGSQTDTNVAMVLRVLGASDFGDVNLFHQSGADINYAPTIATISADTWHQLTVVYDATPGLSRLYVDGVQVAETATGTDTLPATAASLALSLGSVGASAQAAAYLGRMAHLSTYWLPGNRADYASILTDIMGYQADDYGSSLAP